MAAERDSSGASSNTPEGPTPIGVKFGSNRTVIVYRDGEGTETVQELTCLTSYRDRLLGDRRELYGDEAASEYPNESRFVIRNGMPADEEQTDQALRFFEQLLETNDVPEYSSVVFAVPAIRNTVGLRNLARVIEDSPIGVASARAYPESLCGSLQAFDSKARAIEETFLAVNMGATTLGMCAYSAGRRLRHRSTSTITGDRVDRAIAEYIEDETQGRVNLDETTAREYKERHADLKAYEPFSDVVQQPGGGSFKFTVERGVTDAVDEYVDDVVAMVSNRFLPDFSRNHPTVYEQLFDAPVVVTGGMACIPGLVDAVADRLSAAMQRRVTATRPPRPDLAAARGAYHIAVGFTE